MDISYRWLDDEAEVAAVQAGWKPGQRLFVDTEFMRERTYWPQLALVQLNDGHHNLLIDPKPMSDPAPLAAVFRHGPLVLHGCSEDLETLRTWPGVLPGQVEDTQIGAALCGFDLQCGYQRIVELLLDVRLPKSATRTDWLQRPLSEEQLDYAVQDVHFLPAVHEEVSSRLAAAGRLPWWQEECERLLRDAAREAVPEELWRQVKGAVSLDDKGRCRLQVLAAWRDRTARAANLPRSFVLKDAELLAVAQSGVASSSDLARLELHPSFVRRHAEAVLGCLAEMADGPVPPPLPGPPEPAARDCLKRLRDQLNQLAASLQLSPEVLARRRWLESLVREPDNLPEPLTGWRHELVALPLLKVL